MRLLYVVGRRSERLEDWACHETAPPADHGGRMPRTGALTAALHVLSVVVFTVAAAAYLFGAFVTEAEEAYFTWSHARVLGLVIFGVANVVAAALAAVGRGSAPARAVGIALMVPAVLLMNEAAGTSWDSRWLMIAGAAALVALGGLLASGLHSRLFRLRSGP
jgi:hypothetical protein